MTSQNTNDNYGLNIIEAQNKPDNLKRLAAQKQLYSHAKRLLTFQVILTVFIVVILSLVSLKYDISSYFSMYCVIITFIDILFINSAIDDYKEKASQIQEFFDTDIFNLEWNSLIEKPDHSLIFRFSEIYKKTNKDFSKLKNWYPESISKISTDDAIIICQRSNCNYDTSIRSGFAKLSAGVSFFAIILIIISSSIRGVTVENLFSSMLLPLLPVIAFTVSRYRENNSSLISLNKLYSFACDAWSKSINEKCDGIKPLARQIQDKIYDNRKNSPLIFDWYYNLQRNKHEGEMNYSADQLVQDFLDKRNL